MRIVVVGAGGVGGFFGARLAEAGNDVTLVARGAHLEAIRRDGVRIASTTVEESTTRVHATERLEPMEPADLVIVAVKLWSTEDGARAASPAIGPATTVVSLQNGIDAAERIGHVVGAEHVIGGVTYISSLIESPGVIRVNGKLNSLVFGEFDGSRSPRVAALDATCAAAGIEHDATGHIDRAIWEKFVFLVGASATTSLYRSPIGAIRSNPRSRALLFEIMREVVAVALARGVDLDPAFAENRLAFADAIPKTMRASMAGDLERGNRLELPWLSGTVAKLGDELGVPTPANHFVVDALALAVDGRRP